MMVELRWIQMSLFLMLLLQFTGANGQLFLFIRSGHDVTLPCENVIKNQNKCGVTTWSFGSSGSTQAVDLIKLGQIVKDVGVKSGRLRVTEDCSLVIEKVTDEDASLYFCLQFDKSGQKPVSHSEVLLSVVSLMGRTNNDEVTLNCSVSTYEPCTRKHGVKWLFDGRDVDEDHKDLRTSEAFCSASVHFKTSHHIYTSRFNSLKCEVTDGDKVQLFSFITGPSDEEKKTTTKPPPTTTGTTTQSSNNVNSTQLNVCSGCSAVDYIMLVLRVVELLLITVITVLLFRASGNWRPSEDLMVRHDEDEGVVEYDDVGDSSVSVVLH